MHSIMTSPRLLNDASKIFSDSILFHSLRYFFSLFFFYRKRYFWIWFVFLIKNLWSICIYDLFFFKFLIKLLRYIYFVQYINVGVERNLQRSIFIPHEKDMIGKYTICLTIFLDYTSFLLIKLLYKLYWKLEHFFENINSLFYNFCCIILCFSSSFFSFNPTQV